MDVLSPPEGSSPRIPAKFGLALSGGGFRAAFFHLGVLARLAERGRLRRLHVISTVSGGSIVGALYYLHVRDLLQAVAQPTDEHYVHIVERMETDFLQATERNIRALATADLGTNVRMRRADYSRTDRLGELYDELLYRPAWNNPLFSDPPAEPRTTPIEMRELVVVPGGPGSKFNPDEDNASRPEAPVPVLLINATSLNSGHSWRFEAVAMGEPLREDERWVEIDKNTRYARTRYEDMTPVQANFPLGIAVAASACVPALFHPLAVSELFEGKRVQLVDGGVHDNQGVCGLFDTGCTDLIVSDASGQLSDLDDPSTRIPASLGRSTRGVYGDRVREEQLSDAWRNYTSLIVHLRRGLPAPTVYARRPDGTFPDETSDGGQDYGVNPKAARLISQVRTDLDAFSEIEAYSLGAYGYAMTSAELDPPETGTAEGPAGHWQFQRLAEPIARPTPPAEVMAQLENARKLFLRSWRTSWTARIVAVALGLIAVAAAVAVFVGAIMLPAWIPVTAGLVTLLLVALYFEKLPIPRDYTDWLFTRVGPVLLAPFLWLGSRITLALTPAFLDAGRADGVLAADAVTGEEQPAIVQ
jgi:predicted acylesterase/phospholipase RssA